MTPQQIVGLAVRIFAIWLVVMAFQVLGLALAMNSQLKLDGVSALYFMPALPLLLAVFLWLFPMFVAHKLVPRSHDQNALRIPARELTAAASAIIGIWVCIAAMPQLLAQGAVVVYGGGFAALGAYFSPDRTAQLIAVLLQCLAGITLLLKPWSVAARIFPDTSKPGDEPAPLQ